MTWLEWAIAVCLLIGLGTVFAYLWVLGAAAIRVLEVLERRK